MTQENLPDGWIVVPLIELIEPLQTGSRPRGGVKGISNGIPSLGAEHLDNRGSFRFDNIKYVPIEFYENMERGHIRIGDMLIVKDGATTGKISLVRPDFPRFPAVVNEHVFICRPLPDIESDYLFQFLYSEEGQRRILAHFQGAAQGGINQEFAVGTIVPLAPIAEQHRIAARANTLVARIKTVRESLSDVPAFLNQFRQAILAAACSGHLTEEWREAHRDIEPASVLLERIHVERRSALGPDREPALPDTTNVSDLPDGWVLASMEQLTSHITSGPRNWKQYYRRGTGTFIMAQNIRPMHYDSSFRQAIDPPADSADAIRTRVRKDDLLVTIVGANTCDVCRFPENWDEHYVCQSVALMRPVLEVMSDYLNIYMNSSEHGRGFYEECMYGQGRPHLSFDHLKTTPVFVPPLAEQGEIVRQVERLMAVANEIEVRYQEALQQTELTMQSVLADAFRGDLVPTEAALAEQENRSYEPATVLLERIRAQRAAMSAMPRPPRVAVRKKTTPRNIMTRRLTELPSDYLTQILREKGELLPLSLYRESGLSIDDFYIKLKQEQALIRDVRPDSQTCLLEAIA